jgi:hypothetical protein
MATVMSTVPPAFHRLVDDAAIFPPGNAPLAAAVRAHHGHARAPHSDLVGSFVLREGMLADLLELLEQDDRSAPGADDEPLTITVVAPASPLAIENALLVAQKSPALRLGGLEVAVPSAESLHAILSPLADVVGLGCPVYLELPEIDFSFPRDWLLLRDTVAEAGHRLKFRTGGRSQDMFPSSQSLAAAIGAALDRELAFKCTAGLHHALRHRDPQTGFEHQGFLNVLRTTQVALAGGSQTDLVAVLEDRDPPHGLDLADLAAARRWFRSFGSCSIVEPLGDLEGLRLLNSVGAAT